MVTVVHVVVHKLMVTHCYHTITRQLTQLQNLLAFQSVILNLITFTITLIMTVMMIMTISEMMKN